LGPGWIPAGSGVHFRTYDIRRPGRRQIRCSGFGNSIAEVWELGLADSKLNGTLIGMGIGIGAGAVAAGTAGQLMSNEGEDAWGAMMLAVGAGIGTLTGFAVDSSIKGERLIYRK
jgi:hypothetical protein